MHQNNIFYIFKKLFLTSTHQNESKNTKKYNHVFDVDLIYGLVLVVNIGISSRVYTLQYPLLGKHVSFYFLYPILT